MGPLAIYTSSTLAFLLLLGLARPLVLVHLKSLPLPF